MNLKTAIAFAAAGSLVLAACGDDDTTATTAAASAPAAESTATPGAATGQSATPGEFNDADVEFAQSMITHHEQAIEMADMALDPEFGASADVVDLAVRIEDAQGPEIDLMTGWLRAWGQPTQMDTSGGHDMEAMDGMMPVEDMNAMAAMTGPEFDRMWLEMMIAHHEGAIAMAERIQTEGSNPDVIDLAEQIVRAQRAEIDEMRTLLDG